MRTAILQLTSTPPTPVYVRPFSIRQNVKFSNQLDVVDQGFYATSTIKDVYAGNFASGLSVASGSITFNLGFSTSCSSATSTWQKLFTTDQTVSSIGSRHQAIRERKHDVASRERTAVASLLLHRRKFIVE